MSSAVAYIKACNKLPLTSTIHHQGLRLALGAFRTSPVESLYAESNEPSLYIRREKLSLQYVTKLAANPRNSAHDCVFNPKYERFYNNKPTAIKPLGLRIQPLLEEANINIKNVQHFSFPSKEPWTLNPPKIILDLHKNKKTEVESHIFKNEFLEIKSNYKHYLSILEMVRNKMRKLLVLLLVQILLTVSDYLIIAPFLPPKPRQLILHFTISEISLKNSLSFIQILFLY